MLIISKSQYQFYSPLLTLQGAEPVPAPAAGARPPLPRDDPRRAGDMAPAHHRGQGPYGLNLCQTGT